MNPASPGLLSQQHPPKYVVSLNILVTNMICPECRSPDDACRTFGDMRVEV